MGDIQEAKNYLEKIRHIDMEVDAKEETRARMKKRLTDIQATQHREIDVQGGKKKTVEDRMVEYLEYSQEVDDAIDRLVKQKREAINLIDKMDSGLHRTLLTVRYVNNKKWEEVAEAVCYGEGYTSEELHKKALKEFKEVKRTWENREKQG